MALNFSVDDREIESLLRECDDIISKYRDPEADVVSDAATINTQTNDLQTLRNQIDSICENVSIEIESVEANNSLRSLQRQSNAKENQVKKSVNNILNFRNNAETEDDIVFVDSLGPSSSITVIDLCTPTRVPNVSRKCVTHYPDVEVIELEEQKDLTENLKLKNSIPNNTNQSPPKVQCAICLDSALKRTPTTTICGHIFCYKCIVLALKSSKKCPLCKKPNPKLVKLYGLNG